MLTRKFGRTGMNVRVLGFGAMELGKIDDQTADVLLNTALDEGINYIDTSPEYPKSEYYIGKTISHRRDEFIIATKCGDNMLGEGPLYIFDKKTAEENVNESLRLLKTDHLDVLQMHGVIPEYVEGGREGELMEFLMGLKKSGKVLHVGLTVCGKQEQFYGYPAGYGYNSILPFAAWPEIEVIQLIYGGLTRLSENVIQKAYDDYGTAIVARGTVKKYFDFYDEQVKVARLPELFEEGENLQDFLIRFSITHPGLSNVLVGTKNVKHLKRDIEMANKGPLSDEVYQEAKARLSFAGLIPGPVDVKTDW